MFTHVHKKLLHVQLGVWRLLAFKKPWLMFKIKRPVTWLRLHCTRMSDGCWVIVYSTGVKIKQNRTVLPSACDSSLPMTRMNFHANIARGKCFSDILQNKLRQVDKNCRFVKNVWDVTVDLLSCWSQQIHLAILLAHCSCIFIIHKTNQNIYVSCIINMLEM